MLTEVTNVDTKAYGAHTQANTAIANTDTHEPELQRLLFSYEELYNKLHQFNVPLTTHTTGKQLPSPGDCNQPSILNTVHSLQYLLHSGVEQVPTQTSRLHSNHLPHYLSQSNAEQSIHAGEIMIALRDLPLLQHREFKIHGGPMGDTASDISYNSICKQVDEGLREKYMENEIISGVA